MDDESLTIECQLCGKPFEPNPDSFCECGLSMSTASEKQMDRLRESGADFMTVQELIDASPAQLAHLGIDETARAQLLRGENATTGAMAICPECQEEMAREGKLPN